jgi:hypothetical protein
MLPMAETEAEINHALPRADFVAAAMKMNRKHTIAPA